MFLQSIQKTVLVVSWEVNKFVAFKIQTELWSSYVIIENPSILSIAVYRNALKVIVRWI